MDYGRGQYTADKEEDLVPNHARKLAGSCTQLPGVGLVFDAVGGGAGFGPGALLLTSAIDLALPTFVASLLSDGLLSVDVTKFQ
eukprot:706861-Pleurochrysis_carterae.AAC.1